MKTEVNTESIYQRHVKFPLLRLRYLSTFLLPKLKSPKIGRIGRNRYFCLECYHEWIDGEREVQIFEIFP